LNIIHVFQFQLQNKFALLSMLIIEQKLFVYDVAFSLYLSYVINLTPIMT